MSTGLIDAKRIAERLAEALRIKWLQVRADAADDAIRQAHEAGIRQTEALREFARQRDAYRAELAALQTRHLLNRINTTARVPR